MEKIITQENIEFLTKMRDDLIKFQPEQMVCADFYLNGVTKEHHLADWPMGFRAIDLIMWITAIEKAFQEGLL